MKSVAILRRVITLALVFWMSCLSIGADAQATTILNYQGNSLDPGSDSLFVTLELQGDNLTDIVVDETEASQNLVIDFTIGLFDTPPVNFLNSNTASSWSVYLNLVGGEMIDWDIYAFNSFSFEFFSGATTIRTRSDSQSTEDYYSNTVYSPSSYYTKYSNEDNPGVWSGTSGMQPVPEPSTFLLLGGGLAGLGLVARRRRKK
jgi:hypothetical protein